MVSESRPDRARSGPANTHLSRRDSVGRRPTPRRAGDTPSGVVRRRKGSATPVERRPTPQRVGDPPSGVVRRREGPVTLSQSPATPLLQLPSSGDAAPTTDDLFPTLLEAAD
ncbi:uncharacterized protein J3R85_001164 [Psidium guajava]|nr:uncharacterized protein J3R85_001164 [Psidium guajava]